MSSVILHKNSSSCIEIDTHALKFRILISKRRVVNVIFQKTGGQCYLRNKVSVINQKLKGGCEVFLIVNIPKVQQSDIKLQSCISVHCLYVLKNIYSHAPKEARPKHSQRTTYQLQSCIL